MPAKEILVVFGATGNQGGSVIKSILSDPISSARFDIRAVTRDPQKASAATLGERRVALVKADLDDKDSLRLALENAYAVFAVTNWQEVLDKEKEIQQGKNVADIAKELNIQHLIWSSLPNVTEITNDKITGVLHFDSKAIVEEYIQSLHIPYTSLQLGIFFSFVLFNLQPLSTVPKSYKLSLPISSTTKIPLISVNEDTGKYVKSILLDRKNMLGRRILAAEKFYTVEKVVDILKRVGGVNIIFERCSEGDFKKGVEAAGMPGFIQDDLADTMRFVEEYGFFGGKAVEDDQKILKEPLESFEEWVAKSETLPQFSRF